MIYTKSSKLTSSHIVEETLKAESENVLCHNVVWSVWSCVVLSFQIFNVLCRILLCFLSALSSLTSFRPWPMPYERCVIMLQVFLTKHQHSLLELLFIFRSVHNTFRIEVSAHKWFFLLFGRQMEDFWERNRYSFRRIVKSKHKCLP